MRSWGTEVIDNSVRIICKLGFELMSIKKKVFISYDYKNDRHYKNLLLAWDKNLQFDFYINDEATGILSNGINSNEIKSDLLKSIEQSSIILVLLGERTAKNKWVRWEIAKAIELGKPIVAVKTAKDNETPPELFGIGVSWAMSFNVDSILNAMNGKQ
jgi:hypothetical protein